MSRGEWDNTRRKTKNEQFYIWVGQWKNLAADLSKSTTYNYRQALIKSLMCQTFTVPNWFSRVLPSSSNPGEVGGLTCIQMFSDIQVR